MVDEESRDSFGYHNNNVKANCVSQTAGVCERWPSSYRLVMERERGMRTYPRGSKLGELWPWL